MIYLSSLAKTGMNSHFNRKIYEHSQIKNLKLLTQNQKAKLLEDIMNQSKKITALVLVLLLITTNIYMDQHMPR